MVWPRASVTSRRRSIEGHGLSGLTWSAVTGDTPPQSSIPASMSPPKSSERFGGAWRWMSDGRIKRATAMAWMYSSSGQGGMAVHRGADLRKKVLNDDFLDMSMATM